MADLIAYQDGNWTGATTWKGVATSTGAKQATTTSNTNTTTSYVYSSTFTVTNSVVIEGLLLYCRRLNTTGTVSVALSNDNGTTATREVTVNASDLPAEDAWVFFKFGSTLTGDGGTDYRVGIKGSSTANANFARATAGNWARYLRTNATASIATTDVTFICNELTGTGAKTDITVTMDSTASTTYGECNIGQGGVLSYGTSASTNYILDLGGNLNVWAGGTLNIGTSGTRMPSTSTAVLEFTMGTNVLYGLEVRAGGTCNLYGATKTTTNTLLTADAASGQKILTVQSTSGWAANDTVALPSTTRDRAQGEKGTIATVDSGTQVTLSSNLTNTHHGTSPFEGEVMNLTRNVKIRGTSQSLCTYVNCAATAVFAADYVEFYWLGSNTSSKYGLDFSTTTGTASITNCSIYDYSSTTLHRAINLSATATYNFVITDNAIFVESSLINTVTTTSDVEFKRNYVCSYATAGATANGSLRGQCSDNRFIGFNPSALPTTAFSDNLFRSGGTQLTLATSGSYNNLKILRCTATALLLNANYIDFTDCVFADNATFNVQIQANVGHKFINCTFDGGTGGTGASQTTAHLSILTSGAIGLFFDNCSFSANSNPTNFISLSGSTVVNDFTFRKCVAPATVSIVNQSNMSDAGTLVSGLRFDKFNNTSGSHRTYKRYGRTEADQATFKTAAPSEALLPNGGSGNKLPSGSKKFAVASGTTATVTVFVNKSATYNGNQPRLIVKANSIAGIASDTVLATASGGTGSWLTLSGTTATVSDDCVLEVFVDCDGTAGTVYVDDWSVS